MSGSLDGACQLLSHPNAALSSYRANGWRYAASDSLMGIARDQMTNYRHQLNAKIERMHRRLKNSLRARLPGRVNWLSELSWVILGLRAASNLDRGVSPSILVTGQQPTLPGQLVAGRPTIYI